MDENSSKVYILIDEQSNILRCEGGYTQSNIENINDWILIDEGFGDRYNLCQSHYFTEGLYTYDGIPQYKFISQIPTRRPESELLEAREMAAINLPMFTIEESADMHTALQVLGVAPVEQ